MFTTTLPCPHCGKLITVQVNDNQEVVFLLDKNKPHSPTSDELKKLSEVGIELGIVPCEGGEQ